MVSGLSLVLWSSVRTRWYAGALPGSLAQRFPSVAGSTLAADARPAASAELCPCHPRFVRPRAALRDPTLLKSDVCQMRRPLLTAPFDDTFRRVWVYERRLVDGQVCVDLKRARYQR